MLCSSALRRVAAQASRRPTTDVTAVANRLHRLTLFNGSARTVGISRALATANRPVGRPKKGGAVTARARTTGKGRAPAKKAASKPKKAVKKKAKAAPKKRKVLTEKQKQTAERKKHVAQVKELTAASLLREEPKAKPATAWLIFSSERIPKGQGITAVHSAMKDNGTKYKSLSPSEREHYNHLANQAKADNEVAYKRWVESHTPEEILNANAARRRLKQILIKGGKAKKSTTSYSPIHDDRQVKRPLTSYGIFYAERQKSGDLKEISIPESARLVSDEWKALSQAEKKTYDDLYKENLQRYIRQYKDTYGFEPPLAASHAASASVNA